MKLTSGITINENIITAKIAVAELGNTTIDGTTELNQLHNFVRNIEYSQIDFKSNMKLVNNMPVVTTEPVDDTTIEEITILNLINKTHIIDENFAIDISFDTTKIPKSEYETKTVFNSPEILGQAYAILFIEKIKNAVAEKLTEIRALSNDIETETDVVI